MRGMDKRGRHRGLSPDGAITAQLLGLAPLLVPPRDADAAWSWVNQGGATTTQVEPNGVRLLAPAGSGDNWRLRVRTQPSTPYTVKVALAPRFSASNTGAATPAVACGFRESGSSELLLFRLLWDTTNLDVVWDVSRWTNETTYSTTVSGPAPRSLLHWGLCPYIWLTNTGAALAISYALDGDSAQGLWAEAVAAFLTPDQVCWGVNADSASEDAVGFLMSWDQG